MADSNGKNEWRDEMEQRVQMLERARKELEDSFIVMAQLEARMSQVMRQQAEWLANQDARLAESELRLAQSEARFQRIETSLAEAAGKIDFIIDREMRREGGPETQR